MVNIQALIFSGDEQALSAALISDRSLVNATVALPDGNPAKAPLLHRICDAVHMNLINEHVGVSLAKILIDNGAPINVSSDHFQDSPLTAACSLKCDQLALLYIANGSDISHQGCYGGTALHWAAWCGRDEVAKMLLTMNPAINQLCVKFKSTPLFWAIHGYKFGGPDNLHRQAECAKMLLQNGADKTIPNFEGYKPADLVGKEDLEMLSILE